MGDSRIYNDIYIYVYTTFIHACMEIANDMIRVSSKMGDGLPTISGQVCGKNFEASNHGTVGDHCHWCKGLLQESG